ncbi:MAG: glutaminyl-peptide cyclotransferase [Halioglobus sp.]|nr:glutaminyl-peptide cyclotransferase [Halioglobus sp.]
MRLLLLALALFACALPAHALTEYTIRVLEKRAQPKDNFVQGLEIHDGMLYVSTGQYGQSRLLRYRFQDMALERGRRLHPRVFGEGLTVLDDVVYQLTWRNRAVFTYRKSDFDYQTHLSLPGEGWGLTNDGVNLVYSDGSDKLYTMSTETGRILHTLNVTQDGKPVRHLNELEWVGGAIWANVWRTDRIVIINPDNGKVTGTIDLAGLLPDEEREPGTGVLNGIAVDPANGDLWVTGKHWPWLYRIELIEPAQAAQVSSTALE